MEECSGEKQSIRNVVIKLRFRRAEAFIRKCKHKITRLNDIISRLSREKERQQGSENHLLNDLAEHTNNHIADYNSRKGLLNARIVREEKRKFYLLELDRLTARERFNVYSSHLSNFISFYSEIFALVFLLFAVISGIACLETGLSLILIVLTVIFFTIAFFLFLY